MPRGVYDRKKIRHKPNWKLADQACQVCGKTFRPTNNVQKYCSPDCRLEGNHPHAKPKQKVCPTCQKEFTANHGARVYCSTTCRQTYMRPLNFDVVKCVTCGKTFRRPFDDTSKVECVTCSGVGARVRERRRAKLRQRYCTNCSTELPSPCKWKYCAYCAERLNAPAVGT
jgi:hypothetical protein